MLASRGIPICPDSCECTYQQICGKYFVPCNALAPNTNVKLFSCAASSDDRSEAQAFTVDAAASRIRSKTNSSICFGVHGKDSSSGQPNLALVACDPSDDSQAFKYDTSSQNIVHMQDGHCVDLTGGGASDGTNAELYQCGEKQTNQVFSLNVQGQFVNRDMCLDACVYA